MTSTNWSDTVSLGGIFDDDAALNPALAGAHKAYVRDDDRPRGARAHDGVSRRRDDAEL